LPIGFTQLELSQLNPQPGEAVGVRGMMREVLAVTAVLDGEEMDSFTNGSHFVALTGKGGFFGNGMTELAIRIDGRPLWSQPWQFTDPNLWQYQEITLTGTAAEIDQVSIEVERERLFAIWEQNSPQPQWNAPFQYPITDYLEITSSFGARRSYNGGPYRTYHEGVDFSAYGGTAVSAPAAGTVVLAEQLYVRGGAVIIDHGLGIYTGYYHLSEVLAAVGDVVQPGQVIGAVGTTGLSTGNHWDLLVDGVWVDAQAWVEQDMACWLLAGMDMPCAGNP
jgi:biotin carboxyl carrier protein